MLNEKCYCPVCNAELHETGESYDLDEIFRLWHPVVFSSDTIDEHRKLAESTGLFTCPECKLEVFVPRIIGTPAFYVEAYNLNGAQPDSDFTYSEDKWDFVQAEQDLAGHDYDVLEFGCGNGDFLERVRECAVHVAGLEYNPAALKTAKARGLQVYSPSERSNIFARKWDAVFSFHVLEHVEDPVAFVKDMAAAVKEDGVIGICVPNQQGPIRYMKPCVMNMPPHHATRWSLPSFEALAERLGLVITRVAYEPLLLENHSFYSIHWVKMRIPGKSVFAASARYMLSWILRIFFGGLRRLGFKSFPLRGQSIYVSMKKLNQSI